MVESVWVPKNCWIRANTEKLSGPVRKNCRISVSTEKLLNPGDHRQKTESVRVPKNCPDQFGKIFESVWVPEHCWIQASNGKSWNPCKYWKTVRTSSKKWKNQCEYRKIVESGRLLAKDGIRASTEKLSEQFEKIFESVWVPEHYWIQASNGKSWNPCEYRKTVRTSSKKW